MEFIELQNLFKTYYLGEIEVPVLRGVSLTVARGEFVALMGASGSGKTTLMNILGCLDRPTSGQYWLDGEEVSRLSADARALVRNHKLGFVFQNFSLLPRTSARDNVAMPLTYTAEHLSDREVRLRVKDLLQRFGLGERLNHEPSQLSGGQQQRVAIARALVNQPPLLFADELTGNLDSRTSDEVLQILRQLNEDEGITIILVTHDEDVARHAKRIIRIHDGIIVDDAALFPAPGVEPQLTQTAPPGERRRVSGRSALRLRRMLGIALNGLRRNVMRSALTALGIIIGVAAVIAMMEIGRGSSSSIQRTIANMGANNLLVMPGTASSGGASHGAGTIMTLTPQDAEALLTECPAVRAVAPVVRARTQVIYGNRNWVPAFIYGTTSDFLTVREWGLDGGEVFTDRDVRNANKVCLLGQRLVRELFQGEDPIGKEIRVQNVPFRVVGILGKKGANMMGMDEDDILLAPWTTIKFRVIGSSATTANQSATATSSGSGTSQAVNTLNQIYPTRQNNLYPLPSSTQAADTPQPVRFINVDHILAAARTAKEIPAAIKQITGLLRERHRIRPGKPDDFNTRDMTEMAKALSSTATTMTKLLLAVALISLVVGGVGIMNIMLVSVTERTREIGLRLAVGAYRRNILQQFLVESVVLCFCGGAAGIVVGRSVSYLMTAVFRWPTELSPDAIVSAFAISAAVGIIFGYYPAWKASRLDPIMALRYE
ncbi:MAG: ABC transporter permease [Syntrophobacterales bacterium]|jgi:macrolide transport system ATP-binding/permease protein|nr:ABC transporter permease [Syntrophobacterales bacterium]